VHIGTSPHGGHYITYARNISENPNLWYTFDDGYVTEKEVLTFGDFNLGEYDSPYILFYGSQTGRPVVARGLSKIKKVVSNKRE
jgi:ubiquitin C-terminal hydrolase